MPRGICGVHSPADTKTSAVSAVYSQTATLVSPPDGSTVSSLTPTFEWTDAPIAGLSYQVQIDDGSHNRVYDSPTVHAGIGSLTPPPGELQSGETYYWLVSAVDCEGDEVLTDWETFSTP